MKLLVGSVKCFLLAPYIMIHFDESDRFGV